jgi:hypothetical protein
MSPLVSTLWVKSGSRAALGAFPGTAVRGWIVGSSVLPAPPHDPHRCPRQDTSDLRVNLAGALCVVVSGSVRIQQCVDRASVGALDHDWDPVGVTEFAEPSGEADEPGGSGTQALGRATESDSGSRPVPTTGPLQRPARKSVPQ